MAAFITGQTVLPVVGLLVVLLSAADGRSQSAPAAGPANGVLMLLPPGATPEKLPAPKVVPPGQAAANPLAAWSPDASLALPTCQELFRVESETSFRERLRADYLTQNVRLEFPSPPGPAAPTPPAPGPPAPPRTATFVPSFFCYRPLYFEDRNTERYGWTVPVVQPLVSTGKFYLDTLLLPYSMAAMPPNTWECNSGSPRPGDPVPYFHYLTPSSPRAQSVLNPPPPPRAADCPAEP